ncbi:MAG: 50S ribosomal protein L1 [Planctomycetes bacterium]|nr:50S ribosomal protein L1 [Planctomycetota bacterium]
MAKRSKRYEDARSAIDRGKRCTVGEAISLLKGLAPTKFDQTVEIAIKLNIDDKQSDQKVRGAFSLPKGIGREVRVVVFAAGDKAKDAEDAGADVVGAEDLVERIGGGWMDFDVALATPDMMRLVGKLGRVLGPAGMMPSPKSGTVVENVGDAVREFKAGKLEYRNDSGGNIHAVVGKLSFSNADLEENIEAFIRHIAGARPAPVKGTYMESVSISSSMSPGIKLAVSV